MATNVRKFFVLNFVAIVVAFQVVVMINYWFFIYNNDTKAVINDTISYNGKLIDSFGTVIPDGNYKMRFSIYDSSAGGNLLWTEIWDNSNQGVGGGLVTITGGVFSVELNSLCENWTGGCATNGGVDFNNGAVYLEVELDVDGNGAFEEVFSPRKIFSTAAYANNSDNTDGAGVGITGTSIPLLDTNNTYSGINTITTSDTITKNMVIKSSASQSANLSEFTLFTDVISTYFDKNGILNSDYLISNQITSNNLGKFPQENTNLIAGYWKFDDAIGITAVDEKGINNATLNSATWTGSGAFGYSSDDSLSFNGADYVDAGIDSSLDVSNYTLEAWFNTTTNFTNDVVIASRYDDGVNSGFLLGMNSSEGLYSYHLQSGSNILSSTTTGLNDGAWHHAILTFENGVGSKLYLDGKLEASTSATITPILTYTQNFYIGAQNHTTKRYFTGKIDNVVLYNTNLNANQIYNHYRNGIEPVMNNIDSSDSNLISMWSFDEGNGTNLLDEKAQNNGIIIGTGVWSGLGAFGYQHDNSLTFDGTGDYVNIIDNDTLDFGTSTNFSINAWVKRGALGAFDVILDKRSSETMGYAFVVNSSNQLSLIMNSTIVNSTTTLTDTTDWHQITVTVNRASIANFYIDGIDSGTGIISSAGDIDNTNQITIGGQSFTQPANELNGNLDNVSVYNRLLTDNEILQLYNEHATQSAISFNSDTLFVDPVLNLILIKNNSIQVASVDKDGAITIAGLTSTGQFLKSLGGDIVGLTINASNGQKLNLTEWKNNSGSVLSYVDSAGNFNVPILNSINTNTSQITSNATIYGSSPSKTDANIVGYWTLDDNAIHPPTDNANSLTYFDFTEGTGTIVADNINSNTCTINGNPVWKGSGPFILSDSITFDGSGDWLDCGSNASLGMTGDYTVMVWFRATNVNADNNNIVSRNDDGIHDGFFIRLTSSGNIQGYHYSGGSNNITSSSSYNDSLWHLASLTFKVGVGSELFVDGISVGTAGTVTTAISSFSQKFIIGAQDYTLSPRPFIGDIGHVSTYSSVLTNNELKKIYAMGKSTLIADSVGSYSGTIVGTQFSSSGNFNYNGDDSIIFDGITDYIDIGPNLDLSSESNYTFESWFYQDGIGSGNDYIWTYTIDGSNASEIYTNGTTLYFNNISSSATNALLSGTFSYAKWNHVVATLGSNGAKLYINGIEASTDASIISPANMGTPTSVLIGAYNTSSGSYTGKIDNSVVYNRQLSANEAIDHYSQGLEGGQPAIVYDTKLSYLTDNDRLASIKNVGVEKLYIGLNIFGFTNQSNHLVEITRNVISNNVGYDLSINSGGATNNASDKKGGDLYLSTGLSTGFGSSDIYLQTSGGGTTGTFDKALITRLIVAGDGSIQIGDVVSGGELRFYEGSNYLGFKANSSLTADQIWELPATDGLANQVLTTDANGSLIWNYINAYSKKNITTASGTVLEGEELVGVSYVGAVTITLPTTSVGRIVIIKDEGGNGNITIVTPNSETIDGQSSINVGVYGKTSLISDGTNWFTY